MAVLSILMLIVSLVVLVKSSDYFVDSSSKIAKHFGLSELVIGLTLVAIGTSLPELASSLIAAFRGHADLAIGNVIGSNIANILLILGVAALIANLKTKREMLDRDGMILVAVSILFYWILVLAGFNVFIKSPLLIRISGIFLLLICVAYLLFLVKTHKEKVKDRHFEQFINYIISMGMVREAGVWMAEKDLGRLRKKYQVLGGKQSSLMLTDDMWRQIMIVFVSCAALIVSAHFFIDKALWAADVLKVSGGVIGMTLVAVGTSLPELMVSILAAKKGFGDMAIGNIIGSNIINILLIGGMSIFIAPAILPRITLIYVVPFMVFTAALLLVFIRTDWELRRTEGFVFLLLYAIFIMLLMKGVLI